MQHFLKCFIKMTNAIRISKGEKNTGIFYLITCLCLTLFHSIWKSLVSFCLIILFKLFYLYVLPIHFKFTAKCFSFIFLLKQFFHYLLLYPLFSSCSTTYPFRFICTFNYYALVCSVMSNSVQPHGLQPSRLLLSMGFPRQKYWNRLSFPSPGDLLDTGSKSKSPESPALAVKFFTTEPLGKPFNYHTDIIKHTHTHCWLNISTLNPYFMQKKKKTVKTQLSTTTPKSI